MASHARVRSPARTTLAHSSPRRLALPQYISAPQQSIASPRHLLVTVLAMSVPLLFVCPVEAETVGVNYGRVATNLPNPTAVV